MNQHYKQSALRFGADAQAELEARLAERWAQAPATEATIEEAFGPFEEWTLSLEQCTLLLHPAYREWFYLDPIHDTWEPTGVGPGEVEFIASGTRLGYRHKAPAGQTCTQCGHQAPRDSRFCPQCGTRLAPIPMRCPACEFENQPDSKFCTRCGTRLGRHMET